MAVVRSSESMGDCRELSTPSSPGQEPGVPRPQVPSGGLLSGTGTGSGAWFLENRWWAEKDLGSSCFLCLEERLLLTSSRKPESSPSVVPELMQLVNTLRLLLVEVALSKSSVCERVIFLFRCPPNPKCRVLVWPLLLPSWHRATSDAWPQPSRESCAGSLRDSLLRLLWKLIEGVRKRLRRLPVLLELELVLDGDDVWTPLPTPPDEGEDGSDSCLLLALRRNMGSRETRVERRCPDSPIKVLEESESVTHKQQQTKKNCHKG